VIPDKIDFVTEFARRGLKRKGLDLLGVIPHQSILSSPNVDLIREELHAELLNSDKQLHNSVDDVVVGAMGVNNAMRFFKRGVLLITPGDREDIILAAATTVGPTSGPRLAGIVLTGGLRPSENVLKVIRGMPFPVLLATEDSYEVASKVHDLTVKTRPDDTEKISIIRDLIVDMTHFFAQYHSVKPYLVNDEPPPEKERLQSPREREELNGLYECILCACCSTACPSFWWNPDKFVGPAGLLNAYRFIADSRDLAANERLDDLEDPYRLFRCHTIMNCVDVCPKGLNPTLAIGRIKELLVKRAV